MRNGTKNMVKVLIADDSAIVRAMLSQVLGDDSRFEVTALAENGKIAVEMSSKFSPDLIVMDLNMPVLNGLEAIIEIMKTQSPSIVVFSTEDDPEICYHCLEAGAIDIVKKPNLSTMNMQQIRNFCDNLYELSEAFRKHNIQTQKLRNHYQAQFIEETRTNGDSINIDEINPQRFSVLAIGASTGGPIAIQKVLIDIGPDFNLPIIITQHIDAIFDGHFVSWLGKSTGMEVKTAADGEKLKAGNVYIAPAGSHLCVEESTANTYMIRLDDSEEVHFLKPSVDVMFKSCAKTIGHKTLALLLTGMGTDGAEGMKEIHDKGGTTIAQSEKSCTIYGMPKAALELNAVSHVEDLDRIGRLVKLKTGDANA